MGRHPATDQEVVEQAKASRDRARKITQRSSKLAHETARLEASVHQTEEQLRVLKELVGKARKAPASSHSRRRP